MIHCGHIMNHERLSLDAVKRVSGPKWEALRPLFFQMADTLLNINSDSLGVLTTIYVKFQTSKSASSPVFGVAWLKTTSQIVLGLALPASIESPLLSPAPKGMSYKGLTKYLTVKPADTIPSELSSWASVAYANVIATQE